MKKPDIMPENSMSIQLIIRPEEGQMDIGVVQNLSEDMPEEDRVFYMDALNGLVASIDTSLDHMAYVGMLMRQVSEDEESIEFEPAPELLEAINSNKVVQLKKKLH